MKKLLALAMALTLCLGLAACGGTPAEDKPCIKEPFLCFFIL